VEKTHNIKKKILINFITSFVLNLNVIYNPLNLKKKVKWQKIF